MNVRLSHVRTEATAPRRISTCSPASACRDTRATCVKLVHMKIRYYGYAELNNGNGCMNNFTLFVKLFAF